MFSDKYLLVAVLCNCIIYHIRIAKQFSVVFFQKESGWSDYCYNQMRTGSRYMDAWMDAWMHACIQVA